MKPSVFPRHGLITGASSGLGAALAKRLSSAGTRLSLLARDHDRLSAVAADCVAAGAETEICVCDVTDGEAMERSIALCDDKLPIDLVVANAGIGGAASLAINGSETSVSARQIIETNLIGVINTIAPLAPRMAARQRGRVVIVSSVAGLVGLPQSPSYCASKAALQTYAVSLRRMLAPVGVQVSVVVPGFIDTPMSASLPLAKPLMWTAEKAAATIAEGIRTGRREIKFPWPLVAVARLVGALPGAAGDLALRVLTSNERVSTP